MSLQPYGKVQIALLECRSLTPNARLAAAWITAKPDGWVLSPTALQAALGFSEKQWLSARKSMVKAGIFKHSKKKGSDGKWIWDSKLDLAPLVGTIPPKGMHGLQADIKQRTKNKDTKVRTPFERVGSDLDKLKKMHICHTLNYLDIDCFESGSYITWGDKSRARKAESGHWLCITVDAKGETESSGSAIDLIMEETGCDLNEAIAILCAIYDDIASQSG